jgi:hypothetical protein
MWMWDATYITIQYCISHHNKTQPGAADGGGFDFDGGAINCLMQYDYSYENHGAGYLFCSFGWGYLTQKNVLRYCVTQNDGLASHKDSIHTYQPSGSDLQLFDAYNNVVFNSGDRAGIVNAPDKSRFMNNIIITENAPQVSGANKALFQGNCYWSTKGKFNVNGYTDFNTWVEATDQEMIKDKVVGMFADPKLKNAGKGKPLTDPKLLATLTEYQLKDSSPCINKGIDINALYGLDVGNRDFYGNALIKGAPVSIGVQQY